MLVPALVVAAAVLSSTWFTVTVDRRGLAVRSAARLAARSSCRSTRCVQAEVVDRRPFPEFGGWGYRVGRGGRVGVVLRTGEGSRSSAPAAASLVVTVDDAATGAALLNTLAARARVGPSARDTRGTR